MNDVLGVMFTITVMVALYYFGFRTGRSEGHFDYYRIVSTSFDDSKVSKKFKHIVTMRSQLYYDVGVTDGILYVVDPKTNKLSANIVDDMPHRLEVANALAETLKSNDAVTTQH